MTSSYIPIPNVYSPPYEQATAVLYLTIDQFGVLPHELGRWIGRQGKHFIRITRQAGCLYIFVKDNWIEIWAHSMEQCSLAVLLLRQHAVYIHSV